jgi:uncharacterized protein YjbI with pentapeptide repeats
MTLAQEAVLPPVSAAHGIARLKGANLSDANLSLINLSNADLAGVNFTNTELNGPNLTGANLTAVSWVNTTCPDQTNSNNDGGTCVNNLG